MSRVDEYKEALKLAEEALRKTNLADRANCAGADAVISDDGSGKIQLAFFTEPIQIHAGKTFTIVRETAEKEVTIEEKILLCHYLLHASGAPPTNTFITFRQIPDGHFYDEAFLRRTREPFLSMFGRNPDLFRACAQRLNARAVAEGSVGMAFQLFPRIVLQIILWEGDDELPPESTILFDANIQHYLPAEDIAVLSGMLVYRLLAIARELKHQ